MASKGFTKNSSGKSFEETSNGVTDLSHLTENSFLAGGSMAGGNTISAQTTSLQHSEAISSEQTGTNMLGVDLVDDSKVTDPLAKPSQDFRKGTH